MTALQAPRDTPAYDPLSSLRSYPVDALAVIYEGGIVCLDATGYAVPGATATTLITVGRALASVTGGAADGDVSVPVSVGIFRYVNGSSIAQVDVGGLAYVVDDQTVSTNASGKSIAGPIEAVDSQGVWVNMGLEAAIDNTVVTAFISDLASTSGGSGASLVGVHDTASKITATDVEGALAEIAADSWVTDVRIAAATITYDKLALTIAGEQALSGPGAVDVTHRTTKLTSTGTGDAITLANGTVTNQRKTIVHEVDGGTMILTPATPLHYSTITFTSIHDFVELEWTSAAWIIVGYGGVTINA